MLLRYLSRITNARFWLNKGSISTAFCLLYILWTITAFGQILPYSSLNQALLSFPQNPYLRTFTSTNPYSTINSLTGGYNPFLFLYNNILSQSINTFYPQASVAGGLIPFSSPIGFPYNITGSYFPGAITSFNPYSYLYNAAVGNYFAVATIPADVAGTWLGTWVSTFLAGGVTTGDVSITLAQSDVDVTGTVAFLLNKILKFGANVVGTVNGNSLTLTSTVIPGAGGTKSFDVTILATVNGNSMEGTYEVINNVTGNLAEEGTFIATRL